MAGKSARELLGNEAGGQRARLPARIFHDGGEKGNVVLDAIDVEGVQRLGHLADCGAAGGRMGAELGDHRIVVDRDLAALEDTRIVAHGDAIGHLLRRRTIFHQPARRGQEVAVGIFRIDAAFDGPALQLYVRLPDLQLFAGGHADHLLHEVDAGDQFGDGVFHLQAGIHLEKKEGAVLSGHELDCASRVIIHGPGEGHGLLAHGFPGLLVEER